MMPETCVQNSQPTGNNKFHTMFVFSLIENDSLLLNHPQQLFHFWSGVNIISIIQLSLITAEDGRVQRVPHATNLFFPTFPKNVLSTFLLQTATLHFLD